jgi:hypothetical protein
MKKKWGAPFRDWLKMEDARREIVCQFKLKSASGQADLSILTSLLMAMRLQLMRR